MLTLDIQAKPNLSHQNYSPELITPEYLIIHCIGYEESRALGILTHPDSIASSHYFIPHRQFSSDCIDSSEAIDYPIYRISVDMNEPPGQVVKMYHAGQSEWQGKQSFNQRSIGIEFHIPNYANALHAPEGELNWYYFESLSQDQLIAGEFLIKRLMAEYHIPSEKVLFHSDISPWRDNVQAHEIMLGKTDPGALFPAEYYASKGIGVWPKQTYISGQYEDTSVHHAQTLLRAVGYRIHVTNQMDFQTLYTIKAFKLHYMPEEYQDNAVSAEITSKMISLLENLLDKNYAYAADDDAVLQNTELLPSFGNMPTGYHDVLLGVTDGEIV